ncbi:hypothetical protein [Rhodoplanes azumiensis]|uniref:Uncharacterized protein n=1 Tax=Rhodoplanes azumiensis TaxID=1897628 RepID=A0ABW5AIV2_9BRAD
MIDPKQSEEPEEVEDPFVMFTEWASEADEAAYSCLSDTNAAEPR